MKLKDLFFAEKSPEFKPVDLLGLREFNKIPSSDGCYVIGSSNGTKFQYPWGSSPVYYIGKADNLRSRIKTHYQQMSLAAKESDSRIFRLAKNCYARAFGANLTVYLSDIDVSSSSLEIDFCNKFYWRYGCLPVCNGAWPKYRT